MKTLIGLVLVAALGSGCTMMAVSHHNGKVESAIRVRALPGGNGIQAGVEVHSVKGLVGLFREEPVLGGVALGADILAIIAGLAIYDGLQNDKEDVTNVEPPNNSQTTGGDGVVVNGDYNDVTITKTAAE